MNLENLRTATRPEHEATESTMPLMNPGLTVQQYAEVLKKLYALLGSWEQWAQAHAPADLAETVRARQRASLLKHDLQSLHIVLAEKLIAFPASEIPGLHRENPDTPDFRSCFLGAMYVVEGSTLGGQYIARHVEDVLHLQPGGGNSYFRGYGDRTGAMWNAFKAILTEVPEDQSNNVIASAKAMFHVFADGMRR